MKKFLFLAALAGLLCAAPASAEVNYIPLGSDTVRVTVADSSGVVNVAAAKRMWLVISAVPILKGDLKVPVCDTTGLYDYYGAHVYTAAQIDSFCDVRVRDSLNILYAAAELSIAVQAREVLPSWAGTDGAPGQRPDNYAVADSVVVPWFPRAWTPATQYADSTIYGHWASTSTAVGSREILVYIKAATAAGTANRSVRVDLSSVSNGAPFQARLASFRWRLLTGAAAPGISRLRVVLGYETQ